MVQAKKWILAKHFDGQPKDDDLQLVEETLPDLKEGEVYIEAVYLSVDPYMRIYPAQQLKPGDTMIGCQVSKVIESRNLKFSVGSYLVANVGWRTRTTTGDESLLVPLPPYGDLPLSYGLGVLGMPGMTAYFGLLEICQPKPGEVVLVNGAGGAVGSLVGQIAKIKGCTVIAFAGTPTKCDWLKKGLGFDFVYNHKEVADQEKAIMEAAPGGVDCFFDNVGGEAFMSGMRCMKTFGRVSLCGAISMYNENDPEGPFVNMLIINKQLRLEGFVVFRWLPKWADAIKEMMGWLKRGKLSTRETVITGFENMRTAFYGLFKGDNIGKAIVKA